MPRLSPVPSVLSLSSTRAKAGLETAITLADVRIEAKAGPFFSSIAEHFTFIPLTPTLFGKPSKMIKLARRNGCRETRKKWVYREEGERKWWWAGRGGGQRRGR